MKIRLYLPLCVASLLVFASSLTAQDATDSPEKAEAPAQLSPEVAAVVEELKGILKDIEENGESLEKLEKAGDLYLKVGDVPRAVVLYEKAISSHGGTEALYAKFSRVLGLSGRPQLTVDTLKLGLQTFPDSELLQYELGKQYVKMQKPYAAVANLKVLVDAYPENAEYRYLLADAYRLQQKWEQADALLDSVIESEETFIQAKLMKGDILLAQGEYRDGVRYLEDVYEDNPDSKAAEKMLVHAYQLYAYDESNSGRISRAVRSVRDSLEIDPDNPESMVALGSFLQELGEYVESEETFKSAMEKHPDYLEGYMLYGKLLEYLDRPSEAAELYKVGLEKSREQGVVQAVQTYRMLLSGKRG
ncbi:tetratricopeptide repeat protein [Pelagicoccus mobilis]|uniref:Tetratricopeptide repeat protein n=1 Tax=Pelagicoccus mobilis TaxID=415221 RepID=A0A934RTN3_9BACT|nr:tetratricopeptide repeat protein [Pelagicoccus mobilis]MBK1877390.1 tetratricopeptide repeat protein [Pelagicoccus mobilis]